MRIGHAHLGRGSHADADQRVRIKPTVAVHRAHTNRRARHAALAGRKHRHRAAQRRAAGRRRLRARSRALRRRLRPAIERLRCAEPVPLAAGRAARRAADPEPVPRGARSGPRRQPLRERRRPCARARRTLRVRRRRCLAARALGARAALRRRKQHGRGRAAQRQLQLGHDGVPGAHARRQRRLPTMLAGRAQAPRGLDRRRVSRRPACAAMAPAAGRRRDERGAPSG